MLTFNFHLFVLTIAVSLHVVGILVGVLVFTHHRWLPLRIAALVVTVVLIASLVAVLA